MGKFSFSGSFAYQKDGRKLILRVPKSVGGTFAISNSSGKPFWLILDGVKEFRVKPYGIARIYISSPGFPTRIYIQSSGVANGSFIFQQK